MSFRTFVAAAAAIALLASAAAAQEADGPALPQTPEAWRADA
jgi:hypothetical protein